MKITGNDRYKNKYIRLFLLFKRQLTVKTRMITTYCGFITYIKVKCIKTKA